MDRLLIAVVIVAVAAAIAVLQRRRRSIDAPTQPAHEAPVQLDRIDFAFPDHPWLLVTFTSSSCHTCADVVRKARVLESSAVGVVDVDDANRSDLHDRYRISAVPTMVLADSAGVVRASFLGPISATDLWAAVARAREPEGPTTADG